MKSIVRRSLAVVSAFACASMLGLLASCGGSVSLTPTIDASATAHGICPDVNVQVAGPVSEGPGHLQFNSDDVRIASQCFNMNYTGFDLTFVSP